MRAETKGILARVLLIYGLVAAAITVCLHLLDFSLPLFGPVGAALAAVLLLCTPVFVAGRTGVDLAAYGFRAGPLARGLALGLGLAVALFPLYALGYLAFFHQVCAAPGSLLGELAPPGLCARWGGLAGAHLPPLRLELAQFVLVQLVVVALPEELFFRGLVLGELERAMPPRHRLGGGGVGWALILSAALFALAHLPQQGDPRALATFFPGLLFAWMRSATGSILAGTLAHALSNLWSHLLELAFFQ